MRQSRQRARLSYALLLLAGALVACQRPVAAEAHADYGLSPWNAADRAAQTEDLKGLDRIARARDSRSKGMRDDPVLVERLSAIARVNAVKDGSGVLCVSALRRLFDDVSDAQARIVAHDVLAQRDANYDAVYEAGHILARDAQPDSWRLIVEAVEAEPYKWWALEGPMQGAAVHDATACPRLRRALLSYERRGQERDVVALRNFLSFLERTCGHG